jgi:hypothetical protein
MKTFKYLLLVLLLSLINFIAALLIFLSFMTSPDTNANGEDLSTGQIFYRHFRYAIVISFVSSILVTFVVVVFKRVVVLKWPLWKYYVSNFFLILTSFFGIYIYVNRFAWF